MSALVCCAVFGAERYHWPVLELGGLLANPLFAIAVHWFDFTGNLVKPACPAWLRRCLCLWQGTPLTCISGFGAGICFD